MHRFHFTGLHQTGNVLLALHFVHRVFACEIRFVFGNSHTIAICSGENIVAFITQTAIGLEYFSEQLAQNAQFALCEHEISILIDMPLRITKQLNKLQIYCHHFRLLQNRPCT